MYRNTIGAFICSGLLLGCSSNPLARNEAMLEFSAEKIGLDEQDPSVTITIDEVSRLLAVHGFVTLPCSNYDPKGRLSQLDSFVIMTIRVDEESTCATEPALWTYTGLISNLEPGSYTLRVVQPVPDFEIPSNPSEIVFEQVVEIP